jgi:DnaJ-domain-containing protein 1
MQQLSVLSILRAWQTHGGPEGAAHALRVSRRTIFYRLARATKATLKAAFEELLGEQQGVARGLRDDITKIQEQIAALQGCTARLEHLEQEYGALEEWNRTLASQNRQLREAVAQAMAARVAAAAHGAGAEGQDPYAVLGVTREAPPEVIEAAFKALAKLHHPDRGRSKKVMQRINQAHDDIRRRLGRLS